MDVRFNSIYTVYLMVMCQSGVVSQDMMHADRLLKDKLTTYNKALRPVKMKTSAVVINMSVGILSIQEFDEVQEKISIGGYLGLHWKDENIQWNKSEYGGISDLVTESTLLWRPQIVNINTALELNTLMSDWTPVQVTDAGHVQYYPGVRLTVMCSVNVLYYPFDTQNCDINFILWGLTRRQARLEPGVVDTSFYETTGPFAITESTLETKNRFVVCHIKLERKPEFVFLNIVVPIIMLALLNTLVFFIPTEAGERISYCLTMLLSLAVFLTLVGDNLPKTSNPMSLFSFYLVATLMLSVFITLATIVSMRLYFRCNDGTKPGAFWVSLCLLLKCNRIKQPLKTATETFVNVNCDAQNDVDVDMQHSDITEDGTRIGWKDISLVMDMVFFTVSLFTVIALTVTMAIVIQIGAHSR